MTHIEATNQSVGTMFSGTADPRAAELPVTLAQAEQELSGSYRLCQQSENIVGAYLANLEVHAFGRRVTAGESSSQCTQVSASVQPSAGVANRHGDRYPEEALPYSEDLPPRVRRGQRNSPMTGIVDIAGRSYGEISATRRDPWTAEVLERLHLLQLEEEAEMVANHVEMKVVAMMIRSGAKSGRVIINHAPCGSEPTMSEGCHHILPQFLPGGRSLTVFGTDASGRPFNRTYVGRASQ